MPDLVAVTGGGVLMELWDQFIDPESPDARRLMLLRPDGSVETLTVPPNTWGVVALLPDASVVVFDDRGLGIVRPFEP